ncbi:MAG: hypothetical protein NZ699_09720 [Roseiflexus sp.]|nr:hypothetical protein [Roseiflexus sp.]MDW8145085.1 hypothetical protein [Roseiflexaceae bacterium]MDW8234496.1 hypothetical protein [Roseiflexaceae bacterium]
MALIAPTASGTVVAGCRLGKDDQMIRRTVGLRTERSGLCERLSARQNLVFFARLFLALFVGQRLSVGGADAAIGAYGGARLCRRSHWSNVKIF